MDGLVGSAIALRLTMLCDSVLGDFLLFVLHFDLLLCLLIFRRPGAPKKAQARNKEDRTKGPANHSEQLTCGKGLQGPRTKEQKQDQQPQR